MPQHGQSCRGYVLETVDQDEAMRIAILGLTLALTLTWSATAERSNFPRPEVTPATAKTEKKPE